MSSREEREEGSRFRAVEKRGKASLKVSSTSRSHILVFSVINAGRSWCTRCITSIVMPGRCSVRTYKQGKCRIKRMLGIVLGRSLLTHVW